MPRESHRKAGIRQAYRQAMRSQDWPQGGLCWGVRKKEIG